MNRGLVLVLNLVLLVTLGCSKTSPQVTPPPDTAFLKKSPEDPKNAVANNTPAPAALPPLQEQYIEEHKLYTYPELTVLLAVNDAQRTAELVKGAGGKITYDPNLGQGHDIDFLIVELPPDKILDKKFIASLNLKAISVDHPRIRQVTIKREERTEKPETDLFVPTEEINIPALRKRGGNSKGENILVAVIDTGIDASHPAFGKRVVYWSDLTREGRVAVKAAEVKSGEVTLDKDIKWKLPAGVGSPVYVGKFNEAAMGMQNADADKSAGNAGFDLNTNGLEDDVFHFIIANANDDEDGTPIAFIDTNGNKKLDASEAAKPVMDFNRARSFTRKARTFKKDLPSGAEQPAGTDLVRFPSRSSTIAYPLILEVDAQGTVRTAALGVDQIHHGTHVAGIIAGDDGSKILGSAPGAEVMSMKVCSGITCSESAILRGLVESFYNSEGLVPDVVNISLGSLEAYQQDPFNYLLRDLSAKFGTTFFISASNDGPGYRAINSFGSFGPTVIVGANVSKRTLTKHYTLHPSQNVPEQSLFFFSSVGPSYSGQLRPNIVAPGSAISAVPMTQGRSGMFNGTSMSSPIAAGAAAALLGLTKTPAHGGEIADTVFRDLEARRVAKIDAVLNNRALPSEYSNIDIPLALRTALEESAVKMPEYTIAQRGHGLMDIDAAYPAFRRLVKKVTDKKVAFLDFRLNDNKKGLYDRSNAIAASKQVTIGYEADGEDSKDSYRLINEALTVKLDSVEIQSTDGSIVRLDPKADLENLPFSVAVRGVEGAKATSAEVIINDATKNFFYSLRHTVMMEQGKTYIAHYSINRAGQRLWSFLDVVHAGIQLPNVAQTVDLPALAIAKSEKVAAFAKRGVTIGANTFHRYPIAVTPQDGVLNVSVGLAADESPEKAGGFVYVLVYDPNSKSEDPIALQRSYQLPAEKRMAKISLPIGKKHGIYEVTVAAAGSRWNGPTKYDLLVEALRVKVSESHVALNPQARKTVSVTNASGQSASLKATLGGFERLVSLNPIGVKPNHWTYKRLHIPPMSEGGEQYTSMVLQYGPTFDKDFGFSGRVDHRLWRRLKDGSFEVAYEMMTELEGKKIFWGIERPMTAEREDAIYVAVETFYTVAESAPVSNVLRSIDVEALFPGVPVDFTGYPDLTTENTSSDPLVFSVLAPQKILNVPAEPKDPQPRVRATVKITGSSPDVSFELPVTLKQ